MPEFSISPLRASVQFLHSRDLVGTLIWRDVAGRYRGSLAGLFWSFLNPLFSLAMYTFVFGVVFKARWGVQAESTFDFALILFAGLIVHTLLSDCICSAPYLILGNSVYVKQVVFPLEILPVVSLGASVFHTAISLLLLILAWAIAHGGAPLAILFIPWLLLPLCLITVGCGWLLAAVAVYFRDLGQIVSFVSKALLFFSPIFYPASSVPEPFRSLMQLNPLTYVIENIRATLIRGELPELHEYLIYLLVSLAIAWAGFGCFQKLRAGFADVL
jgi:lipopolysaccharide transport system permease protein